MSNIALPVAELHQGDEGSNVITLQKLLQSQGYFDGAALGHFKELTLAAVLHFQQTHNGPDKRPLKCDGEVGSNTWWALFNPSGEAQRNRRPQSNPNVKNPKRDSLIAWAEGEHAKGIHEIPDGSNWSPRIKDYLAAAGLDFPAPWCESFACCGNWEAVGAYPIGHTGLVLGAWNKARELGMAKTVRYFPRPADQFVMLHGDGTGHTGFIYRVSKDGRTVNTIEGNCANRVALQRRDVNTFAGFINVFGDGDQAVDFDLGLVAEETSTDADR